MAHWILILITIMVSGVAAAAQKPSAMRTDTRIKTVVYDVNNTVDLYIHFDFGVTVEYSKDEIVISAILGETSEWYAKSLDAMPDMLRIKPMGNNVPTTSLYVRTNKRNYNYQLYSYEMSASTIKKLTITLRYKYPDDYLASANREAQKRLALIQIKENLNRKKTKQKVASKKSFDPAKINMRYQLYGVGEVAPLSVFDDGKFMYLEFSKSVDLPAVYSVASDRSESMVNFTVMEPYIKIERLYDRLSLRRGNYVSTVVRIGAAEPVNSPIETVKDDEYAGW